MTKYYLKRDLTDYRDTIFIWSMMVLPASFTGLLFLLHPTTTLEFIGVLCISFIPSILLSLLIAYIISPRYVEVGK